MPKVKIGIWKAGPYIGIQQGKNTLGEFGGELQYKRVKLVSPVTHSVQFGANYNFIQKVIGYDLGYWIKPGRLGLTYGGTLISRSNFDIYRLGVAPSIGYKFFGFHFQVGYQYLFQTVDFDGVNSMYVNLRYIMVNHRDTRIKH